MIGALDHRSTLALNFEFDGYAFEFLEFNAWTHAGRPLPRFVLRYRVTRPRCCGTFPAAVGELNRHRVRDALVKHRNCRPLAIEPAGRVSDQDALRFVDLKALERRQRDALFEQNVRTHGSIDPDLRADLRKMRVEMYETKTPEEVTEICARFKAMERAR